MALTPIIIEFEIFNPDGLNPPTGAFTFQLQNTEGDPCGIVDSSTGEAIQPLPITGQIIGGQLLSSAPSNPALKLVANDDPTTLPVGTTYLVTEQMSAGNLDPWPLTVSHSAPGGVINLSSQRPTP